MIRTALLMSLLAGPLSLAEDPPKPEDFLKPAEIEVLNRQKFVVSDTEYRQVFTPYLSADVPVFVTSDSLLNAFHVLFEESVFQRERTNAKELPAALLKMLSQLPEEAKQFKVERDRLAVARQRTERVLGVALRLLDPKAGKFDKEMEDVIAAEVKRIQSGTGTAKPDWLGKPDPGFLAIDYSQFVPRGFYTRTPQLQNHWRAVSWLQAVPFRPDRDDEFLAAALLARASRAKDIATALDPFKEFLGSADDHPVGSLLEDDKHRAGELTDKDIRAWQKDSVERLKNAAPKANDQLATKREASVRVFPAYYLPDAGLLQRTGTRERWPSGLDVAAALGSPVARDHLKTHGPKELLETILAEAKTAGWPSGKNSDSLHSQYLACLRTFLTDTEPDWPKFMTAAEWQWKQCQTALSGWAQQRHTWSLQAKRSVQFKGGNWASPGFVEPVPAFYARFAELTKSARKTLGGFPTPTERPSDTELGMVAALLYRLTEAKVTELGKAGLDKSPKDKGPPVQWLFERLSLAEDANAESAADWKKVVAKLEARRAQLQAELDAYVPDLAAKWSTLAEFAETLAALSRKQLKGTDFTGEENRFLTGYGERLAAIMLHERQAASRPSDDAPRIVDVFSNPAKKQHLHVGIARPRAIFVLYPWDGKEVLCRGAVLPYREFTHGEPLTDDAWRKMLAGPSAPTAPDWLAPLSPPKK